MKRKSFSLFFFLNHVTIDWKTGSDDHHCLIFWSENMFGPLHNSLMLMSLIFLFYFKYNYLKQIMCLKKVLVSEIHHLFIK